MKLRQLKIDFAAEQDRLLMQLATSEGAELRLWLTRRFVKLLWPLLVQLAEDASPRMSRADFSKPYEAEPATMPLGAEPLLLARIQTGRDQGGLPVVALHPAEGQGLTLSLDSVLLHSVCRLLQAAVRKTDWDIDLNLPGTESQDQEAVPRTIN
jgi:hypothetical protein